MASPAQVLANQANAQHSTGPRTEEGKARSSRNHTTHGFTLGVFTLSEELQPWFCKFEADLTAQLNPQGALESEALRQFLDAAARLRQMEARTGEMIRHYKEDPLMVLDALAELRQLARYRAAAEMIAYRAIRTLRELQSARLFRTFHLTPGEDKVVPPLAEPGKQFETNGQMLSHNDREIFYHLHGDHHFTSRFPQQDPAAQVKDFATSKPTANPPPPADSAAAA